ncbi:hypothetical protein [Promicromonospora soli]
MTNSTELDARRRRAALWIIVGIIAVVIAVPLLASVGFRGSGPARRVVEPLAIGLGLGIALVFITAIILAQTGQRSRLRALVAEARPGATVIPAFAESPGGLTGWVPVTIVVAVLADRVEVWAGSRDPLSTVALTNADVRVDGVLASSRRYPGIRITNGADSLSFVPIYSAAIGRPADLERALRELGEDPADHVRHPGGRRPRGGRQG